MHPLAHATTPFPLETVLVVDADADTRELYAIVLADVAREVQHASDGRIALAVALARPPALIIADARLPYIDGFMLCDLLRRDAVTATVPLIITTAEPMARHRGRIPPGASAVLVKPIAVPEMMETIRSVVTTSVADVRDGTQRAIAIATNALEDERPRLKSRSHQRYATTIPPLPPPTLRCPRCDGWLTYLRSYIGGVNANASEQWDIFDCPAQCGSFEYRHRTKRLKALRG